MLSSDDRSCYEGRAETELEMAQRASQPEACRVHFLLAGYYLDRIRECADDPPSDG